MVVRGPPGAATSSTSVLKCPYQGENQFYKGVNVYFVLHRYVQLTVLPE